MYNQNIDPRMFMKSKILAVDDMTEINQQISMLHFQQEDQSNVVERGSSSSKSYGNRASKVGVIGDRRGVARNEGSSRVPAQFSESSQRRTVNNQITRHSPHHNVEAQNFENGPSLDRTCNCSLLDDLKSNKIQCQTLSDIAGHIVEFSKDKFGSSFIQEKLETCTAEELNVVFEEILPQAKLLIADDFANYMINKLCRYGSVSQVTKLADKLTGSILFLSLHAFGSWVIPKVIEVVDIHQRIKMAREIDGHVMMCSLNIHGNHVIQKLVECIPESYVDFIVTPIQSDVIGLSINKFGCRVIQQILESNHYPRTRQIIMYGVTQSACLLAGNPYGNFVIQKILVNGLPGERSAIISRLPGQITHLSMNKFGSHVIEQCLKFGTEADRWIIVSEVINSSDEVLEDLMMNKYANYVIQSLLKTCNLQDLPIVIGRMKSHLDAIKNNAYGMHIAGRIKKLIKRFIAEGESRQWTGHLV